MRKLIIAFYCLTALLLANCGQPKTMTPVPATRTPLAASEIIARLNRWDAEDIDVALCSTRHPDNRVPSGETSALITRSREKLKDLGVYIRWNCETQTFEITTEENQKDLCGCK